MQLIYLFCPFQVNKRKTNWMGWEHRGEILCRIHLERYRRRIRENESSFEFGWWEKRRKKWWFWWFKYQEVHEWINCVKPCQNMNGLKFVSAVPKMVIFGSFLLWKKTPLLVQLKQIFGPLYFVTALVFFQHLHIQKALNFTIHT